VSICFLQAEYKSEAQVIPGAIQNCHRRVTAWTRCLTRALGHLVASYLPVRLHSCFRNQFKAFRHAKLLCGYI